MGPRKRPKTNPKANKQVEPQSGSPSQTAFTARATILPVKDGRAISPPRSSPYRDFTQPEPSGTPCHGAHSANKGWYGGTWSRKATPVTQVAKESISAAGGVASEAVATARAHTPQLSNTPLKSPTVYLSRSMGSSSRSLPLATATTKLNITSNAPTASIDTEYGSQPVTLAPTSCEPNGRPKEEVEVAMDRSEKLLSKKEVPAKAVSEAQTKDQSSELLSSNEDPGHWFSWFSKNRTFKSDSQPSDGSISHGEEIGKAVDADPHDKAVETIKSHMAQSLPSDCRRNSDPSPIAPAEQQAKPPRSWLGLWGNASKQFPYEEVVDATKNREAENLSSVARTTQAEQSGNAVPLSGDSVATARPPQQPTDIGKSYGWSFWSRDGSREEGGQTDATDHVEKVARADPESPSKPEGAVVDKVRGIPNKVETRQRPQSLGSGNGLAKANPMGHHETRNDKTKPASSPVTNNAMVDPNQKGRRVTDNLLLPSFKQTYSVAPKPGIIQQLGQFLQLTSPSEPRHLAITQSPHRIKKALAIGVHGYFPAPLIRSVLGQPTGTSVRFANGSANAIQRWTRDQHYTCEVEKVALEGEGKIAERIELLWKLMLNWIEKIRKADFVMITCHSQGVPVAIILVAKLIAFGCVNSARIGVCAMAGVNLGPFADYKSRWISGSAGELFDFALPDSKVSKDYQTALDESLRFGVKITYIGSIDDQLVSLESSTFGTINHPNIYRAVFIDGRVHAPDFLSHLVGFVLKIRNLGISDHGLVRELSQPLAGSLYSGEGHSRIYDDEAVYYLAIQHTLETTDAAGVAPTQIHRALNPTTTQNPYILPFAMRGLLEEEHVRTNLHSEITELIKQFDDWRPSSKVLKDVKFRLEGVRSKL